MNSEKFEPFDDGMEVVVEYDNFSKIRLATEMPENCVERMKQDEVIQKDVEYFAWVVEEFTNQNFYDLAGSIETLKVSYIINLAMEEIIGEEITPWEEYGNEVEGESFINEGSLSVNR